MSAEADGLRAERDEAIVALRGMHAAVDVLMARLIELDSTFYPTKSIFWADVVASNALLERFK